jgi:hypothetical protein
VGRKSYVKKGMGLPHQAIALAINRKYVIIVIISGKS